MSSMERPQGPRVVPLPPRAAINPHPIRAALLMVAIFVAGVAGVAVAMSMGHPAFVLSIVLITFGLIAANALC